MLFWMFCKHYYWYLLIIADFSERKNYFYFETFADYSPKFVYENIAIKITAKANGNVNMYIIAISQSTETNIIKVVIT